MSLQGTAETADIMGEKEGATGAAIEEAIERGRVIMGEVASEGGTTTVVIMITK